MPDIRKIMSENKIFAKKNYGQNFLTDFRVIEKIIAAAQLSSQDSVLEIGAGLGSLTYSLAEHAYNTVAFEIDTRLSEMLKENFSADKNVEIISQDFLTADLNKYENYKIIANLPYYITAPAIFKILEEGKGIKNAVLMVQKEVAQRILSRPNTPDYGAMTVSVSYYGNTELVANVPPNCFVPRPNVDSSVIKITPKKRTLNSEEEKLFFTIVKASFSKRRKTLVNALSSFSELNISKIRATELINQAGLDLNIRGETLSTKDFENLAKLLK
jgi:16S rRNA (adenine1518-N6/adenine1519-N6)-dimethyltransferase